MYNEVFLSLALGSVGNQSQYCRCPRDFWGQREGSYIAL